MGQNQTKSKPLAVVISDIHYTLNTLDLADTTLRMAIDKAAELNVYVIDCGDITNDKAILRAEVVSKILNTYEYAKSKNVRIISLVGNHSLLNERSTSADALDFMRAAGWDVIRCFTTLYFGQQPVGFIPYQPDPEVFYRDLRLIPPNAIVFAHQGNVGGDMGDYVQDPSAVDPSKLTDRRIFSGHYHKHYENKNWVSIGNPYSLTFGEANDPEKGFLIVYGDGSYRRQLTGLRRHVILDWHASDNDWQKLPHSLSADDLLWIKLRGTPSELAAFPKDRVAQLIGRPDFKLDKIPTETPGVTSAPEVTKTSAEIMDGLVDALHETPEQTEKLKALWREAMYECA
jgi:hypothetical protein